jgi:hypothetical protein
VGDDRIEPSVGRLPEGAAADEASDPVRSGASTNRVPTGGGRSRRGILAALAGLAVCVVLAAGLLVVQAQHPSPNPTASTPAASSARSPGPSDSPTSAVPMTIGGIDWQTGETLPQAGEVTAAMAMGDEVFALGYLSIPGRRLSAAVWSSTDGLTWNLLTRPDTFSSDGSFIQSASSDGQGGLLASGLTYGASSNAGALWHSKDGRAWTPVSLGSSEIPANLTIAVSGRTLVAEGIVRLPDPPKRQAWWSTDGVNWTATELPAGLATLDPVLLAGGAKGFEFLVPAGSDQPMSAWHSDDGRTWVETQPPGLPEPLGTFGAFSPTSLLTSDGVFVAVGSNDSPSGRVAAWTSVNGRTWSQSAIGDPGNEFGCKDLCRPAVVAQVGASLVAVGYAKQDVSVDVSPAAADVVWTSGDAGRTWNLGSGPNGVRPAALAALDSQPILLGTTDSLRSFRGSIAWKPAAAETPPTVPSPSPTPAAPTSGPSIVVGPITFHRATMPKAPAMAWDNTTWYLNGRFYSAINQNYASWKPRLPNGPLIWESDDGTNWRQLANEKQFNAGGTRPCASIYALAEDGAGGLVAVGGMAAHCGQWSVPASIPAIWRSSDGVTWRRATIEGAGADLLQSVASSGGRLVASGAAGTVLYSSDHGQSWHAATPNGFEAHSIVVAPWQGGFIAAGQVAATGQSDAWKSSDGRDWVALGKAPVLDALLSFGNLLVGEGLGAIYWSSDGYNWSTSSAQGWWAIGGRDEVAVAVTQAGEIWTSTDGRTWRESGTWLPLGPGGGGLWGRPTFCVGAGRLVTILTDITETQSGAFYADLVPGTP